MLRAEVIEKLFDIIDETSMILSSELQTGYLRAMCESCQNIIDQSILQSVAADTRQSLQDYYNDLEELEFAQEEIRKALQLAILKGLKADRLTNETMTPDSIALIMSYLASKFIKNFENKSIGDLAVGTGNLLTAVLNHLQTQPEAIYGVDIDPDLIQVAYVLSDMQEHEIQFYQQSSLKPLFIDPLDAIISDLPVGPYDQSDAPDLDLTLAHKGCSYLPYLLIENQIKYLKPGGYGFYLIPNDLFNQEHSADFHQLLTSQVNIQALLQLPTSLFKTHELGKSLFVIQKQGDLVKPVNEVLVAQLPNLNDPTKFSQMLTRVEDWITINK